jgi:hypothetical protein
MTTTTLLEGYISRADAARESNTSERTLARYENVPDGLPSILWAGRKYYRIEAFRDFLLRRERKPNPRRAR